MASLLELESRLSKLQAYVRERDTYTLAHSGPEEITVVQLSSQPLYALASYEVTEGLPELKDKLPEGVLCRAAWPSDFPIWMEDLWTNVCGRAEEDQTLYMRRSGDRVALDFMFKLLKPYTRYRLERDGDKVPDLLEYIEDYTYGDSSSFSWLYGAQAVTLTLLRSPGLLLGTATPREVAFIKNAAGAGQAVPDILVKLADGHDVTVVQLYTMGIP